MTRILTIAIDNVAIAFLLALLVWGITRLWKCPPVAHLLWVLVLVKLVTPPLVLLNFVTPSLGPVETGNNSVVDSSAATRQQSLEASEFLNPASSEFSAKNVERKFEEAIRPDVSGPNATENDVRAAVPVPLRIRVAAAWSTIRPALIWAWVAGIAVVAITAAYRIVRFQRMLSGTLPASQRLQSVADDLASRMGLRRSPDVRVINGAASPLVWCLGRAATVILPLRLLDALNEHQAAMVLAHELAHLRRRDHWVRVIELVVSTLHWWNPLVWWVRRRLHAAEEQCCDAWVAWIYPGGNHDYAKILLDAAEIVSFPSSAAVLTSRFLNTHTLKERIESVLKNRTQRAASRWAVLCVVLLTVFVIPVGLRGTAEGQPQLDTGPLAATSPSKEIKVKVAPDTGLKALDRAPTDGSAASEAALVRNAVEEEPVASEFQPFQGNWSFQSYGSLKWPAELEEAQSWQWAIRGQEITWIRPGQETIKLSFTVDPNFTRGKKGHSNQIELTFLEGPDKGEKCLGYFYWFANTEVLWVSFQDPGEKTPRPSKMGFNGYDKLTVIALQPSPSATELNNRGNQATVNSEKSVSAIAPHVDVEQPLPSALQVFQGTWNFGLCDSILWNTKLDVIQKTWTWKIQGQEITWIRWGKGIVRLSFTIDPSKTPNEIDFTFLDGPNKGEKCQGIYEFERNIIHLCMTEPGAKVDRPKTMSMSSDSQLALIILQDKNKIRTNDTEKTAPKQVPVNLAPAQTSGNQQTVVKPVVTERSPLEGTFKFEDLQSEKWAAKGEEFQAWQWTFQGQKIIWSRPKQDAVRLSYTLDPSKSLPEIELTFLDGPDKGQKCRGVYLTSRHEIQICFQDPGAKVDRPKYLGAKPGSQHTAFTLTPTRILTVAEEIAAFQGHWKMDIYYSDWWPYPFKDPPPRWSNWRWTVKGNEINWTGLKIKDVKVSFTLDPSKSPRQIDLTLLDGPHKGTKLLGIYKFGFGDSCDICFADPGSKVDRPTDFSYGTNNGQTWAEIIRLPPEKPVVEVVPEVAKLNERGPEIDSAIARLTKFGAKVREFHPRSDPQYWVQIISENFSDANLEDVEIIGRGVPLYFHLANSSVTPAGLGRLASAGRIGQLELSGPNIDNTMLKVLPTLPLQGQLGLYSDLLTDAGIQLVAECPQLTSVTLEGKLLTNACLEHLTGLPKLVRVSLGKNFTRGAFEILGRLEGLTILDVSALSPQLSDLMKVPRLRVITLSGKEHNDDTARTIAETFNSLELAYLRNTSITNIGVQHLSRLEKLQELTLDESLIDDGVADSIRKMKQLKWLSVGHCKIGDDTLAAVSECPELWYLFLVSTPVTDKGIAHLAKLKKPLALYLAHCKSVTDASIESLAQLPDSGNLHLELTGSGITEEGVNRLKAALPHAQIRWEKRVSK